MADIHIQRKQPHTWTIIFIILIAVLIIMFLIIRHNSSPQFATFNGSGTSAVTTTIPTIPTSPPTPSRVYLNS